MEGNEFHLELLNLMRDEGLVDHAKHDGGICTFKSSNYVKTFIGLEVRDKKDRDKVIGCLFRLKAEGKIQDFSMLSLFPNNIQVYAKL